jgi:MFS transporter, PAT family, beta-lactamase induction signal transducer AmpG
MTSCARLALMKSILLVFASWRMAVVLFMGFSSGIPLGLTGGTLQAWMASENVDLTVIGVFSLVGLPYSLKFFWSPLMDRSVPPFLGRRRGWVLITQICLILAISALAFSNPVTAPGALATMAVLVAFFSASQDIVIDAYRTEVLKPEELGAGSGVYIMGYRIAMLVSGALALILADHLPWRVVYLIMASVMLIGVITTILAPEPKTDAKPPKTLSEAVARPVIEFFKRRGVFEILIFILIYKLDVVMAMAMTTPFMLQIGFTKTDIGAVTKGFGMVATIIGTLTGGALMTRLGLYRSLWLFGILQGLSGLSFTLLAHLGHHYPMMVTAITVENFCSGMGTAAYSAFLMSLCNKRFTATQYALLSSLMALSRVIAGTPTGYLAKTIGWEHYFLIATFIAIPGLLMLTRYQTWIKSVEQPTI